MNNGDSESPSYLQSVPKEQLVNISSFGLSKTVVFNFYITPHSYFPLS